MLDQQSNSDISEKSEIKNLNQTEQITPNSAKKLGGGLVISIIILSVLSGAAAGVLGSWYFNHQFNFSTGLFQNKTKVSEDSAIIDVVDQASPAVVSIVASKDVSQSQDNQPFISPFFFDPFFQFKDNSTQKQNSTPQFKDVSAGSGFLVSADGLILTNKHVVSDSSAKYTVYTSDGGKYDAKVLSTDPLNDLALIKIEVSNAQFLSFADSSQIKIGQRTIAIGNSLGEYKNTVTTGIVSGIGRNITAGGQGVSEQLEGVIQTDAAINFGNSGGPLLNIFGEVIGVNTAIDQQGQLVGFAIPSNDAKKAMDSYAKFSRITRPFLGVRYVLVTPAIKEQNKLTVDNGAWVISGIDSDGTATAAVVPGSAADKAGLKNNDIILSVDNQAIDQEHSLASLIKNYNPDDKITLKVLRDNKQINIEVNLEESK